MQKRQCAILKQICKTLHAKCCFELTNYKMLVFTLCMKRYFHTTHNQNKILATWLKEIIQSFFILNKN